MGIQNLFIFLKPFIKPIHIEKYSGKRVGIDAYSWPHKGVYSYNMGLCLNSQTDAAWRYLKYFMHHINRLRHYNIIPVDVFNGGSIPASPRRSMSATGEGKATLCRQRRSSMKGMPVLPLSSSKKQSSSPYPMAFTSKASGILPRAPVGSRYGLHVSSRPRPSPSAPMHLPRARCSPDDHPRPRPFPARSPVRSTPPGHLLPLSVGFRASDRPPWLPKPSSQPRSIFTPGRASSRSPGRVPGHLKLPNQANSEPRPATRTTFIPAPEHRLSR